MRSREMPTAALIVTIVVGLVVVGAFGVGLYAVMGGSPGTAPASNGTPSTAPGVDTPPPGAAALTIPAGAPVTDWYEMLVGASEAAAIEALESRSVIYRIAARDGERFMLTQDYLTGRVNLEIADGTITRARIG
jgi:hypothetical protein